MAGFFETFTRELYVALISMLPVVELRGAIPVGIGMGLNIFAVYIIAVLGNSIPVPIILWLARPAVKWLKSTKLLSVVGSHCSGASRYEISLRAAEHRWRRYDGRAYYVFRHKRCSVDN